MEEQYIKDLGVERIPLTHQEIKHIGRKNNINIISSFKTFIYFNNEYIYIELEKKKKCRETSNISIKINREKLAASGVLLNKQF